MMAMASYESESSRLLNRTSLHAVRANHPRKRRIGMFAPDDSPKIRLEQIRRLIQARIEHGFVRNRRLDTTIIRVWIEKFRLMLGL